MRILLINKFHYRKGGAERAYFDVAEILKEAGHEVAFFSMKHPKNDDTYWSKFFVSGIDYQDQNLSWLKKIRASLNILWNFEANRKLLALIDEFKPDVAHAHNIYHQISPSIFHVLKRNEVPIVLTLHDYKLVSPNYNLYSKGRIWEHSSGLRCLTDKCVQESFSKSLVCVLEKWLHSVLRSYSLVDVLISPSSFLKTKVQELGWQGEIEVLPNPLLASELETPATADERVPGKLVFFGRLSSEKGIETVLEALEEISGKQLFIIGDGPLRETLVKYTQEKSLQDRVHFKGALYGNDLKKELLTAEAIIIPSVWYENLPYVVTESLAIGAVVIASASGGIVERIQNEENGFLFPMGESARLADILNNLEKKDLETVRMKARESVGDLSPEVFRKKLEALYQSLLKKG